MQCLCEGDAGGNVVPIALLNGDVAVLGDVLLVSWVALSFSVAYGNQGGEGIYEYKLSKTSRVHRTFIFKIVAKIENKGNVLS